MPTISIAYILEIDAETTTIDRVNFWLRHKNITPHLFCTQVLPPKNRIIIVCELNDLAAGYTCRKLQQLQGVYTAECLVPKQYFRRPVPEDALQSLRPEE